MITNPAYPDCYIHEYSCLPNGLADFPGTKKHAGKSFGSQVYVKSSGQQWYEEENYG